MDARLNLKLDKEVIDKAKRYASDKKMSLSGLIEAYLQLITSDKQDTDIKISPFVKSIATGTEIPADLDYKKEYSDYLMKKYK
jgi:hypothetical protein